MFTTTNYFWEYLCCESSYENEKDIQQTLSRFDQMLEIINKTFKLVSFRNFQE